MPKFTVIVQYNSTGGDLFIGMEHVEAECQHDAALVAFIANHNAAQSGWSEEDKAEDPLNIELYTALFVFPGHIEEAA